MNSSHWAEIAIPVCMSNTSPTHSNDLWKRCTHIENAHSCFKGCQTFANPSHFCLGHSQSSPCRNERGRLKSSNPLHLSGFITITGNKHNSNGLCKVGLEGVRGTSPSCHKFPPTWQLCFTFLWLLPPHKYRAWVHLLCLHQGHTPAQMRWQSPVQGEILKAPSQALPIILIKP